MKAQKTQINSTEMEPRKNTKTSRKGVRKNSVFFCVFRGFIFSWFLFAGVCGWAAVEPVDVQAGVKEGENGVRVWFTLNRARRLVLEAETEGREKPFRMWVDVGGQSLRRYVPYGTQEYGDYTKFPQTPLPGTALKIQYPDQAGANQFSYCFFPYVDKGRGLYDYDVVTNRLEAWTALYGSATNREFRVEFVSDAVANCVRIFLDEQYAGRISECGALRGVRVSGGDGASVRMESFWHPERLEVLLPELPAGRASPYLTDSATAALSFAPGVQEIEGIPMRVFAVGRSLDTGKHRETTRNRDLGWSAMASRTAFANGPDFMMYSLPNRCYAFAYVLCAEIPEEGRVPVLGTELTRRGNLGANSVAFDRTTVGGPTEDDGNGGFVRRVGTLTYEREGERRTSPVYLVKHRLNFGSILEILNDPAVFGKAGTSRLNRMVPAVGDYLDFEFVGNGTWREHARSSLQIFGATLVETPYTIEIAQSEQGNLFANDEMPETGLVLTPRFDHTRGMVVAEVVDAEFAPVRTERFPFTLEKAGVAKRISIPLAMEELGWYGLHLTFYDEAGTLLATHEAAFALLGEDTREAGPESPFAAWPHPDGLHNNNPRGESVAEVMHKGGFRKTWYPNFPVESEDNPWGITLSMWHVGNPGPRRSAEEVAAVLDKRVAEFREIRARYPSCTMIQLLHEQGGRDIAPEMLNGRAIRGEYRGIEGNWEVYWCTEAAKRMRKEFPECTIMVGNGSSSSEKVASLVSNGFDLNLVDYLGIESKGFQAMPELNADRESPGMAWTLRETGRRFGYDIPVSACHEYVFRPERKVTPATQNRGRAGIAGYLGVTDYTVRDYLLSLGHGMKCISTGHVEDTLGTYYDTAWGAGGMCKAYPFSYPKRMFVALATLTKVFDKAALVRRVPTGELSTYALEFKRERKLPDYAYAFWTPRYDVELEARFPEGARVRVVDLWGRETEADAEAVSKGVRVRCGSSAAYVIASQPVTDVRVVQHSQRDLPGEAVAVLSLSPTNCIPLVDTRLGIINPTPGTFTLHEVEDAERGRVLEFRLTRDARTIPEVVAEYQYLRLQRPIVLTRGEVRNVGLQIRGNGSFAPLHFVFSTKKGVVTSSPGPLCFDGWHTVLAEEEFFAEREGEGENKVRLVGFVLGSARQALDPLEMAPVTDEVRLGEVVVFPAHGCGEDGTTETAEDGRQAAEVMSTVNDKDL